MTDFRVSNLVTDLLNSSVREKPEPRNEIWATDLGKPFIDRYYSMRGVPYSNPMTGDALQNFMIGSASEKAYKELMNICMLPEHSQNQEKLRIKTQGALDVVGRPDIILQIDNWQEVKDRVGELPNEDESGRDQRNKKAKLLSAVDQWSRDYPTGIKKTVVEIKTISIFALQYMRKEGGVEGAYPHYILQLYTYMKALGLDEGRLLLIAKGMGKNQGDIQEVVIKATPELEAKWMDDVVNFSRYFNNKEEPPKEPMMVNGKTNWRVSYSAYKDLLYTV